MRGVECLKGIFYARQPIGMTFAHSIVKQHCHTTLSHNIATQHCHTASSHNGQAISPNCRTARLRGRRRGAMKGARAAFCFCPGGLEMSNAMPPGLQAAKSPA
jgi:hypothetical protein